MNTQSVFRESGLIAKWLFIVYATGVLASLGLPAVLALIAGFPDVMLSSIPIAAWIVAPAALAALLATRAKSRAEAWLFVVAETAEVASTAWLSAVLFLSTGSQNAQSGVALLLLPLAQWAALLLYGLGRHRDVPDHPEPVGPSMSHQFELSRTPQRPDRPAAAAPTGGSSLLWHCKPLGAPVA